MSLAPLFIAAQIYNESTSNSENEAKPNEGKEQKHTTPTKKGKKHSPTASISPITIKPHRTSTSMSQWTPTKMDVAYNHNIDKQFVEDVMSDIELNWSAVERDSNTLHNNNRPHPMVDSRYIIQKYSETEHFHSDVTVSCESDIDPETDSRSTTTTPAPMPTVDEEIIDDLMDEMDLSGDLEDDSSLNAVARSMDRIQKYLVQRYTENRGIFFDKMSISSSNHKICLLDSKGLSSGVHEWSIQILKVDVDLQEIGVIGRSDIEDIDINDDGIQSTTACKARCVYGNELASFSSYITSSSEKATVRQFQDLSKQRRIGWCVYDTITVHLDLEHWTIRFSLNNKPCGEEMALQRDSAYYPVISFAGNCLYDLR